MADYWNRWFAVAFSIALPCALLSCGKAECDCTDFGPPSILAKLDSFPTGAAPPGFTRTASVVVGYSSIGAVIPNAVVTVNSQTLAYDATNRDYEGNVQVAPGGSVNLSVTVGANTYSISANQFTSYPVPSAPASGSTWASVVANDVAWSEGNPGTNAIYGLGVLDAAAPNGSLIWPLNHALQELPLGATSFSIPAASITPGNRLLIAGIMTSVDIPNAARGSSLVLGGFNYAAITVTGMPVSPRKSGTGSSLFGVGWTGKQFVAVGERGTILTAPDGATWTSRSVPPVCGATCNDLQGVAASATQTVAVGGIGTILTSPDGITWTPRTSGTTSPLLAIAWSGSQFVAVGAFGTILTSPDGITWTSQTSGTGLNLSAIAWSGTQFVAVGSFAGAESVILASADGVSWVQQQVSLLTSVIGGLDGLSWSGAQFVAVGTLIDTSPGGLDPGVVWTEQAFAITNFLTGVAWTGTQFLAVGQKGYIITSPDGITWTAQASGTANNLFAVASSGTEVVVVGAGGIILSSP